MFGNIVGIKNNIVKVINLSKKAEISMIGINTIFISGNTKYVGSVINVDEEFIEIELIGEIINNAFNAGVVKKPNINSSTRIITKQELELMLGKQDLTEKNTLLIGDSEIYDNFKITVDKNSFFTSHFAILGNTGSGKSCGMARILQNLFFASTRTIPVNAHFVIFDAFNDYSSAFAPMNNISNLKYKNVTCNFKDEYENNLKIPAYFLDVDDLAVLLDVNDPTLIPIINNTLKITYIFTSSDDNVRKYQNSIIASSLLDILSSGKSATQIRDQIIAVLTKFNTIDLNLDSIISQPGYDRTFRQCLLVDNQGKINAINLIVDFLSTFINKDIDRIEVNNSVVYT